MKNFTRLLAFILGVLVLASCGGKDTKGENKKGEKEDEAASYEDVLDSYFAAIVKEDYSKFFAATVDEYLAEHYLEKYGYDEDEIEELAEEVCENDIEDWADRIEDNEDIGDLEKIKYKVADTTEFEKDEVKNIASALNEEYGCKEKDVKEVIIAELELTYVGEDDEAEDEIELVLINVGGDWFVNQLLTPKNVKSLAKSKDQREEVHETRAPETAAAELEVVETESVVTVAETAAAVISDETYYRNNTYQNAIYNYYESIEYMNLDEYVNATYDEYYKASRLSWNDDMDEFLEYCYDDLDFMHWDYEIDFGDYYTIDVDSISATYYEGSDFNTIADFLADCYEYDYYSIDNIVCASVKLYINGNEDSGYMFEEIIVICIDGEWFVAEYLWNSEFVEENILYEETVAEEDYDDYYYDYDYTTAYDYSNGYDYYPEETTYYEYEEPSVISASAADALWNMYCAKTFNDFDRFYGSVVDPYLESYFTKSYLEDFFAENLDEVYSDLTSSYGNDIYAEWKYDTVEYTYEELAALRDYLADLGYSYYAVEDVVSFYSDVTYKGSSSTGTMSDEYIALCVDGNWYISPLFDTIDNLHDVMGK